MNVNMKADQGCEARFRSLMTRSRHEAWKHDRSKLQEFICKTCGAVSRTRTALEIHTRIHSGLKPHKCHMCGKGFAQTSTLSQHMARHRREKNHHCPQCDMSFTIKGDLTRHFNFKHTDQVAVRGAHPCPICKKQFGLNSSLKKHMATHDNKKSNPTKCILCDTKPFAGIQSLRRHLRNIHAKEKTSDASVSYTHLTLPTKA